ncbi:MAG: radical SAM protein [Rickettsiales bacterium]|jgi:radical SAM protein with 4Fe4S-binding SPASM domain|nr:radical SAM protein [Rickettsiales bacterium]
MSLMYYISGENVIVNDRFTSNIFAYNGFLHKKFGLNEDAFLILKYIHKKNGISEQEATRKFGEDIIKNLQEWLGIGLLSDKPQKALPSIRENKTTFTTLFVEVTNKCNLRCKHCYGSFGANNNSFIDPEALGKMIEKVSKLGFYGLNITGGEPFLYPYLEDILKKSRESGVLVTIFSNLTLLNKKTLGILKENGVKKIITSVESSDSKCHDEFRGLSGAFKKTIGNLDTIIKNGFEHSINFVLGQHNYSSAIDSINMFIKNNYNVTIDFVFEEGRALSNEILSKDMYRQFYLDLKKYTGLEPKSTESCGVGRKMIFVSHTGEITLCPSLTEKKFTFGSINRPFSLRSALNRIFEKYGDLACLEKCGLKDVCNGGCRALALKEKKTLYAGSASFCSFYGRKV